MGEDESRNRALGDSDRNIGSDGDFLTIPVSVERTVVSTVLSQVGQMVASC
jgi:hypothetical protein